MAASDYLRNQAIDRFWETIPPLWGMIRTHIRGEATKNFDISVEQFHILRHVRRGTGSISELATAKNISRPAISLALIATSDQMTRSPAAFSISLVLPRAERITGIAIKTNRTVIGIRVCLIAMGLEEVNMPRPNPKKQTTRIVFWR